MSLTSIFKSVTTLAASIEASSGPAFGSIEWSDDEVGVSSQRALIESREKGGLRVVVAESLPTKQVVRVREGGAVYHAEVIASRKRESGVELKLAFLDAGKRREDRVEAVGRARAEPSGATGEAISVEVLNVSAGGLQLLCDRPFTSGATTRIVGDGIARMCRVRYCLKVAEGYRVGLQFCDEIRT